MSSYGFLACTKLITPSCRSRHNFTPHCKHDSSTQSKSSHQIKAGLKLQKKLCCLLVKRLKSNVFFVFFALMETSKKSGKYNVYFKRPGVAGAVLQKPLLLIKSVSQSLSHPLWKYLTKTVTIKTQTLGTWHFETYQV